LLSYKAIIYERSLSKKNTQHHSKGGKALVKLYICNMALSKG